MCCVLSCRCGFVKDFVIIGGGVYGARIAYWHTKGHPDVRLPGLAAIGKVRQS